MKAAIEKVRKDTEDIDFSKGVLTYVDVDFTEYRKKVDTKTVRRNVALLSWLNYEAEHAGIKIFAHVGRLFIRKNRSGNMDFIPIEDKGSSSV